MGFYGRRRFSTTKTILFGLTIILLGAAIAGAIYLTRDYYARTMAVVTSTGTVTFSDSTGHVKSYDSGKRLNTGDCILTGSDGTASIAIDTRKTITIENSSLISITKNGSTASVEIRNGGLFFENSASLPAGESFTITCDCLSINAGRSSGYVHRNGDGSVELILTSGSITATCKDPSTGAVGELSVTAGQLITITSSNRVEAMAEPLTEYDLSDFLLNCMLDRWELRDSICTATGWDNEILVGLGDGTIYIRETEETEETEETASEATPSPTPRPTSTPTPEPEVVPDAAPAQPVVNPVQPEPVVETTAATEAPAPTEATEAPTGATEAPTEATEAPAEQPAEQPA